jgi:flagellar basal-body rod protein FlgF
MSRLLETAGAIIGNEMRRIESLAQNLTNLATPAYKQQMPFQQALAATELSATAMAQPSLPGVPRSWSDTRAGALMSDGNPLHVALTSPGWFEVLTPSGAAYTRQGAFRVDASGRLVTALGHAVRIEGGGELDLRGRSVTIAVDGSLLEEGRSIGRLRVVDLPAGASPVHGTDGLLRLTGTAPVDREEVTLQVGALEASNVSAADNMVRMMESIRRAEMGQRIAHAYDDMLGRALRAGNE